MKATTGESKKELASVGSALRWIRWRCRINGVSTTPTPSPETLAQLLAAVATDQTSVTGASVTISSDATAISNSQTAVTAAQAALTNAQTQLAAANTQLSTDSATLLADALQLQSDVNALVTFLQSSPASN